MEIFSLEDDDCPELFITQSGSSESANQSEIGNKSGILGEPSDFSSPCVSILGAKYSDISDDEDVFFPQSQKHELANNESDE